MRLLQKSAVSQAKAVDRQREIDEGVKLAKRVDSLRQLSASEEKNLLNFRDKTMAAVRAEIAPLHQEKSVLLQDIESLKAQKKLLLQPLDEKWEEVNKAQKICDDWEQELTAREDIAAHKEDNIHMFKASLEERANKILEKEKLVQEIVDTATKMIADAKVVLTNAHNDAQSIKIQAETVATMLTERENTVAMRERDVQSAKESNTKVRRANIERQKQLIDREATLERGFAELKRKQK